MVAVFSSLAYPDILFHARQLDIVQFKIFTPADSFHGRNPSSVHTHKHTRTHSPSSEAHFNFLERRMGVVKEIF